MIIINNTVLDTENMLREQLSGSSSYTHKVNNVRRQYVSLTVAIILLCIYISHHHELHIIYKILFKNITNKEVCRTATSPEKHYHLISLSKVRENLERSKGKYLLLHTPYSKQRHFHIKLSVGFSAKALQTRREWDIIFKVLKEKNSLPRTLYPVKLVFKNKEKYGLSQILKPNRVYHPSTSKELQRESFKFKQDTTKQHKNIQKYEVLC